MHPELFFLQKLNEVLIEKMGEIENKLIARYALTKYALMFITKKLLQSDLKGTELIQNPSNC